MKKEATPKIVGIDHLCPKRWCWSPGRYEHRATTAKGSANTNKFSYGCMHNMYHGCPHPLPEPGESMEHYWRSQNSTTGS